MENNSFIFYRSFYDIIKTMSNKHRLSLYDTITNYVFDNKILTLADKENAIFNFIKTQIDASIKKYNASVNNGKKGGAPKGNTNAKKKPQNNLETTQEQPKNNLNYNYNYNYNLNNNYNQKENTQKKTFESVLACVLDKELKNSLQEFLNMREQLNKPLTPYALELSIQRLATMSHSIQEQTAIVKQSIFKGWLDFYPLNIEKPTKAKSTLNDINELLAEEEAKDKNQDIIIEE